MSPRGSARFACLLCQHRGNTLWSTLLLSSPWQTSSRSVSTARLRRKPSRMTLSPDAAEADVKRERRGRTERGPWANLNQTEARHRSAPRPRSQAQIKRSSRGREDETEAKKESPLYKALKMQTTLAPMQYGLRNAIKERIASIMNFDQFRLLPTVQESILTQALPNLVDVSPTPIQRIAIPALLETESTKRTAKHKQKDGEAAYKQFLLAAETGSGKTLAYLVPVIDAIKRADLVDKEEAERKEMEKAEEQEKKAKARVFQIEAPELSENLTTSAGRPRAIILVPTSELVAQVTSKVKAFAHTIKFRSGGISSTESPRKIRNIVFNPNGIDVLVSTPHLLSSIAKTDPYVLSRVSHLVVDEADSLLDRSFAPTTLEIIEKAASSLRQLILCSATIPRSLDSLLRKKYPDVRRLATPNLHAVPRRVQLGVVDIDKDPYRGNRSLACADVIWSLGKAGDAEPGTPYAQYTGPDDKKIIVFVNEREEADEVAKFLKAKGIDAVSFSRDSAERQAEILADFTEANPVPDPADISLSQRNRRLEDSAIPFVMPGEPTEPKPSRTLQYTKVLVMTDLGSRGIDTLPVKTVILYHVPHTTIDFIHRLGRVGRMGKRGRGIVLVGKKDRKDVVREVREAMFRGQALI